VAEAREEHGGHLVTLDQIRGQERVVARLRRALEQNRVAHAYLLSGPAGVGKLTTAVALTAAIECIDAPGQGCGTCSACSKIAAGIHPDVQLLERQGAAQIIPIETIRTQVIPRLAMPPHEGAARVFLIDEANALPGPSANALLKTLEEPPPRTHFFLCTTAPDLLLPTIRSRCQRVAFAPLSAELRAELHAGEEVAEKLEGAAQRLLEAVEAQGPAVLYRAAADVAGERVELRAVLELFAQSLHARARDAAIAQDLGRASLASRRAAAVLKMRRALEQNAHALLSIEALLHELRAIVA